MKLTDDDFTSHVCDDPSKDGDGLGWSLETDMTTEGKDELIQNQKLRELSEKRVEELSNLNIEIKKDQLWSWHSVVGELRQLLEDSKK